MGLDDDIYTILNAHSWVSIRKPTFYLTKSIPRKQQGDYYIAHILQNDGMNPAALDSTFYAIEEYFTLTFFEGVDADLTLVETNTIDAIGSDTTASTVWEFYRKTTDEISNNIYERVLFGRRKQWKEFS